ncbi:hypothetical protein RCL_jg23708.t1 [Rhizophagus clarus]|uniref:Uncharacterized protein n=1 Tax=Rhizophagus clarus TaxID=94130 RepID=A0A8H3L3I9_9GLOM|nr:hypothetical protein RCL_jg23708.t1 [Rhizophagus clarus]
MPSIFSSVTRVHILLRGEKQTFSPYLHFLTKSAIFIDQTEKKRHTNPGVTLHLRLVLRSFIESLKFKEFMGKNNNNNM